MLCHPTTALKIFCKLRLRRRQRLKFSASPVDALRQYLKFSASAVGDLGRCLKFSVSAVGGLGRRAKNYSLLTVNY